MQTQYNDPKGAIGATKVPLGLIPPHAMEQTAWVHKLGADKYGPWNWRETGVCASTYVNAILRHLNAWRDGEDLDPESGISHLAHIACSANILMDAGYCGKLQDDRNTTRQCNEVEEAEDGTIYRILKEGELVQDGDEILYGDYIWCPTSTEGSYFVRGSEIFRRKVENKSQKHVSSDISYEDDWGPFDEEKGDPRAESIEDIRREIDKEIDKEILCGWAELGYHILKEGEILRDGDEVYVGSGDWMPLYIPHWIKQEVNDGTYRRKLITNCDLKDEVADCDLKEECKCGRRYIYHWLYGWICEDCDLKLSDYYP